MEQPSTGKRRPTGRSVEVERLLERVCHRIVDGLGATRCTLSHWDRARGLVITWAAYSAEPGVEEPIRLDIEESFSLADYPVTAQVLQEGEAKAIRRGDPEADPAERALLEALGHQALLMVPLVIDDQVTGLLEVFQRDDPRKFTLEEIALAQGLVGEAAQAIDLAMLLEAEAAILSARGLEEVLQAVAEQMVRLVGVDGCAFSYWDQAAQTVSTWVEYSAGSVEVWGPDRPDTVYPLSAFPLTARVLREQEPAVVHVDDPEAEPAERALLERFELQSLLMLPVTAYDRVVGLVELMTSDSRHEFSRREISLARSLANQAAIAIENARLQEEREQRITELSIVNEIGQAVSATLELADLLEVVLQQVSRAFDTTNFYIALYEPEEDTWLSAFHLEQGERQPLARYKVQAGLTGYIIRNRRPLLLRSTEENAAFMQEQGVDVIGELARSWMGVPLLSADKIVGVMAVQSYEQANFYDEEDLALFSTIAAQVAQAIDNLQLLEETRRRAQEMAVINEVGRAITSVLDLDTLVQQIVDITKSRFGHYFVSIALLEKEQVVFRAGSTVGESGRRLELERIAVDLRHTTSLVAEAIRTGEPVLVGDVLEDPRYLPVEELPDTRSELDVPIKHKGQVLGVLDVQSDRPQAYDQADVALLQALTSQAGVAIENARFFQERERRITELAIVDEIGRALSSALDLDELLESVRQQVGRLFDTTNFYIAAYEEGTDEWISLIHFEQGERQPPVRRQVTAGLTGYIIRSREPLLLADTAAYTHFHQGEGIEAVGDPAKSWLGVPLIAADELVGVMAIQSYEQEYVYDEEDLALFSTIAAQAAIAIQNARLFQESRRRAEDLASLLQVGTALVSTLDLAEVLEAVCREAVTILHATSAYIAEWAAGQQASTVVAEYYGAEAPAQERISDLGKTYEEDPDRVNQLIQGHPVVARVSDPELPSLDREELEAYGGQSALRLPLIAQGEPLGYIEVWESRYDRAFTSEEILLGQNMASQAAIAIQNARLYDRIQDQVEELRQAGETQAQLLEQVREMSTPVIPVHHRVLVLPLIGVVDTDRAHHFTERLLEAVRDQRARVVLLDITGVPLVDTAVAQALVQASEATRLLGAEVVLVGIRSEVAQTLVTLGLNLEGLVTKANLQAGIEYALGQVGLYIVPGSEA